MMMELSANRRTCAHTHLLARFMAQNKNKNSKNNGTHEIESPNATMCAIYQNKNFVDVHCSWWNEMEKPKMKFNIISCVNVVRSVWRLIESAILGYSSIERILAWRKTHLNKLFLVLYMCVYVWAWTHELRHEFTTNCLPETLCLRHGYYWSKDLLLLLSDGISNEFAVLLQFYHWLNVYWTLSRAIFDTVLKLIIKSFGYSTILFSSAIDSTLGVLCVSTW